MVWLFILLLGCFFFFNVIINVDKCAIGELTLRVMSRVN